MNTETEITKPEPAVTQSPVVKAPVKGDKSGRGQEGHCNGQRKCARRRTRRRPMWPGRCLKPLVTKPREIIVQAFVDGAELTPKGAQTYFYNCRRKVKHPN